MGRPRTFDLEQAVETAAKIFWREGYDKTSVSDLTAALGIVPASFYLAFESKEALFRRVIDGYLAGLLETFDLAFEATTTADAIEVLLRAYADVVTHAGHAPGCLVVNSSPSIDTEDSVRLWLAGHREALRLRLQSRFTAARMRGDLPQDADPGALARFVTTLAGGIAVEARSGATRQELYAVIAFALRDFDGRS